MYCQKCGQELPEGKFTCSTCGARTVPSGRLAQTGASFDQAVADAKSAAQALASTTAQLSQRLAAKAERAAKDPAGSAARGARRLSDELEKARKEIERILEEL
jgi:hypothetical protein